MKLKNDKCLLSLIVIVLLSGLIKMFGDKFNFLLYLCLFIHMIIIFKAKEEDYLPITLFNHTCSSMYSSIGFNYIFNITFLVYLVKMILNRRMPRKKLILLILIMYVYNFALYFLYGVVDLESSMSSISSMFSYLFIVFLVEHREDIDLNRCFKYFFYGFLFSGISALSMPFYRWGFNIPTAYRYVGYLRDANYFAVDALLIMNLSVMKFKKINICFFVTFIIGILSVSKMFLLLSILCFLLHFLNGLFIKNSKYFLLAIVFVCFLPVLFSLFQHTSLYKLLLEKYVYRLDNNNLFTGRDVIQKYYIDYLLKNPISLIFGSSLNYRHVIGGGLSFISIYGNFGAHNTYLDIILAFGLFGLLLYAELALKLYSAMRDNVKKKEINMGSYKIMVTIILLSFFALSYLNIDFFAILIFLIVIANPNVKGKDLCIEVE